jgi:ribonuclease Z
MITITFLGTSSMVPTKTRNHAAVLLQYKTESVLMDCGEGTQRQLKLAGLKPSKITRLLITHWHGDHVLGIPGLLSTMGATQKEQELHIYGPQGTKKYLRSMMNSFANKDLIPYIVHEVKSGTIIDENDFSIETENLEHSTPCIGFTFREKDRRRLLPAKVKKLGLSGPILGKLQRGETIVVEGKKVHAREMSYLVRGKSVAYVTDTLPCTGAVKLASDVDILVAEGTHLDEIKEKTEKYKHMTVKQAAVMASENNVKQLIITHISQRYKSMDKIVSEARTYFDNSIVAEDFMKVRL